MPIRWQVVNDAPRQIIDQVIAKHEFMSDLLSGGWVHLEAIDDRALKLQSGRFWDALAVKAAAPRRRVAGPQQSVTEELRRLFIEA